MPGDWRIRRETPLSSFEVAHQNGCILCSVIHRGITADDLGDESDQYNAATLSMGHGRRPVSLDRCDLVLNFWNIFDASRDRPGPPHPLDSLAARPVLTNNVSDPQCFRQIRQWSADYEITHQHVKCSNAIITQLLLNLPCHSNGARQSA